jgi:hypothetical protein
VGVADASKLKIPRACIKVNCKDSSPEIEAAVAFAAESEPARSFSTNDEEENQIPAAKGCPFAGHKSTWLDMARADTRVPRPEFRGESFTHMSTVLNGHLTEYVAQTSMAAMASLTASLDLRG